VDRFSGRKPESVLASTQTSRTNQQTEVDMAKNKCSLCDSYVHGQGLCNRHYREKIRRLKGIHKRERKKCAICDSFVKSNGLCNKHYKETIRRSSGCAQRPEFHSIEEKFAFYSTKKENGCIEWKNQSTRYPQTSWNGEIISVHRLSYIFYYGEIPDGMCVCHKCDNTFCINPKHLFLDTHAGNMLDKCKKDRSSSKLTNDKALLIFNDSRKHIDIAIDYAVSRTTVSDIKNRKIWKHIHN
jgi:hypothetical protein